MKLKQWFATWSRKIHRWIGLYFAVIVVLYLVESLTLPAIYGEGLPTVDGTPPTNAVTSTEPLLSQQQAIQRLLEQQPQGIHALEDINEITYLPKEDLYRLANSDRFFEWYIDSHTGELLKHGFKIAPYLEEQTLLGWWSPWAHAILEVPGLLLMIVLAVSGVYMFILPFLPKTEPDSSPWVLPK
ncbi:PepSY domain-containing protein [Acaryochloris marina]|uniref:PepSY-associated TM helix n=1 Tax=Acaryochloris marina (strain MBIC 11017) TaxID=329726 RepID=B0C031_ACAM1|nr:PepSY domain-containing protein [Acaryochloris marina]ABW28378.1 hypothetical protein AM1_3384 [Acaryochloris marina MBIC11017]